ncbi:hypothetical protein AAEX28_04470 [Lentisphaerota bacterium WC36G]|nr:hypothetical protein LJT99_07335 [Lentisphaerae bacterium WC36]
MCPRNSYVTAYTEEALTNFYPLNAFRNAILNYIQIREAWGAPSGGKFGWRGALSSGRLFFNRQKTSNNIRVMREVLEIIDSQFPYSQKIARIKQLRPVLSSGGMGRELLDVFLETAVDEKTAYISTTMREDLESSVVVGEGKKYEKAKTLGRGVYGEVNRYQDRATGENIVVKKIHNEGATREQIIKENELFSEVYEHLGKPYFRLTGGTGVVLSGQFSRASQLIMPEFPGLNMIKFARQKRDYDEVMLFTSTFNFLWAMHKNLKIAHRDCHYENVMVLDDLYNVFIIDFGWGVKLIEDGRDMAQKISYFKESMVRDLGFIITSIIVLRYVSRRRYNELKLSEVIEQYNLDRWIGYACATRTELMDLVTPHIMKEKGRISCTIRP